MDKKYQRGFIFTMTIIETFCKNVRSILTKGANDGV